MVPIRAPLVILPPVYELPSGFFRRWCKLTEVCMVAHQLATATGTGFMPTPAELVSRFAALVRPNRLPKGVPEEKREGMERKKIFRFSQDGTTFSGTEVPTTHPEQPPYTHFALTIDVPYPATLFVTERWADETLSAIRSGAVAAADLGTVKFGFRPRGSRKSPIHLGGSVDGGMYCLAIPDCV